MSTIATHLPPHAHDVSLRWMWEPAWRHRRVIGGNLVALTLMLVIAFLVMWANQTPDVSASTRPGIPVGVIFGRR